MGGDVCDCKALEAFVGGGLDSESVYEGYAFWWEFRILDFFGFGVCFYTRIVIEGLGRRRIGVTNSHAELCPCYWHGSNVED